MSRIIQNLEVGLDEELEEKLSWLTPQHGPYRILRQSIDARKKHAPHFVYSVEVAHTGEQLETKTYPLQKFSYHGVEKPIIIGSGPAGLFAALRFIERGIPCLLFERGSSSENRMKGINRFWRYGELDPRNNVCFGEGGAGLYSDGKLITRIKSPHIPYVLQRLVRFGAPEEIQYLSNPHVGSDKLRRVIPKLRDYLLQQGCEVHFDTKVEKLLATGKRIIGIETEHGQKFLSSHVIAATGHSAEDMLGHFHELEVDMEGKSFAMGLRIEHPQAFINKLQYRDFFDHPKLKAANYRLTHHDENTGIGVYSFCMCPGGFVLSSGTEFDGIVCNGMSNYNRGSSFANAAIVVSIDHEKNFAHDLFGGLKLRRHLEHDAYLQVQKAGGTKELPAQNLNDFFSGKLSPVSRGSSPSGEKAIRLDQLLPDQMVSRLKEGIQSFDQKMKGFLSEEAKLYGIESRTSCPIRVKRHEDSLQSTSHAGLYPCGEGAGYAGGITSAACDGIRVAEKIVGNILQVELQEKY